ncbi:three component ABC system middle component [Dactylosporangium sp. CA-152071]|uniref:three component ABC system middle component n=1 Tax=Dactylosporangium sp. CA-152071 TaxID=3239933 RepID=UPI003D91831A
MTAITRRSPEAAALFNPAFTGILLIHAVREYESEVSGPMPLPFAFLVLPAVLHEETRQALPRSSRKKLVAWMNEHPVLRAGFPQRAAALTQITREALRFALRSGALAIESGGLSTASRSRKFSKSQGAEVVDCGRAASLLGRWFASVDVVTAYVLFGVRP